MTEGMGVGGGGEKKRAVYANIFLKNRAWNFKLKKCMVIVCQLQSVIIPSDNLNK